MPLDALPPLTTPRLVVREVAEGDLADLTLMNGDDEVTRHLPYPSWRSDADAQAWLRRMHAMHAATLGRQYVIVLRATERVAGSCLLHRYEPGSARAELGYVLARDQWGRGLMHEALSALLAYAFEGYGLRRVEAEVNPDNRASVAVLERLGFRREGLLRERWCVKERCYDTAYYGLLAADWAAHGPLAAGREHR